MAPPEGQAKQALDRERERRRLFLLRERRQLHFARAAAVGLVAGGVGVLFQWALFAAESFRTGAVISLKQLGPAGWVVVPLICAGVAGVAGWITTRFAREASGSGIPHVKAVLLHLRPMRWERILPVKFAGGILGIGAGLSLGREGPTVQMGAAVGQAVAKVLKVPRRSQSHLLASGAGAGLAAAFNAPLAGFIFVIEELQRELSPITYGTALIAAVCADIVTRTFTGQLPSFHIKGFPALPLSALPLVALIGISAGVLGVVYSRCLVGALRSSRKLRWPLWAKTAAAGLAAGTLALVVPQAVGGGHLVAKDILTGAYAAPDMMGFVALLFAAKFFMTMLSYGSGAPGGIFAPMLVLGSLIGLLVGQAAGLVFPEAASNPAAYAMLGMAAYFASIVRAPLTAIVLILEMTGNYEQLFALAVACLISYLIAEHLMQKPIYEALLEEDLRRGPGGVPAAEEPVLHDVVVEPGSRMHGRAVADLGLPQGCLVVTIKRAGRDLVPGGRTRLEPGDQVTVIAAGDVTHVVSEITSAARSSV